MGLTSTRSRHASGSQTRTCGGARDGDPSAWACWHFPTGRIDPTEIYPRVGLGSMAFAKAPTTVLIASGPLSCSSSAARLCRKASAVKSIQAVGASYAKSRRCHRAPTSAWFV